MRHITRSWFSPAVGALISVAAVAQPVPPSPESLAPPPAPETDAAKVKKLFDELFGTDLARAASTPGGEDDAKLAARLLEAARTAADQPALVVLFCEKAVELGTRHAAGRETVLQAMALLDRQAPDRAAAARGLLLPSYRDTYRLARETQAKAAAGEALVDALQAVAETKASAGDVDAALLLLSEALAVAGAFRSQDLTNQVKSTQRRLTARRQASAKLARIRAQLQGDPANAAARKALVEILVIDFDNPAEAAKHVEGLEEGPLKKNIPLAAAGVEGSPAASCLELGDWYRELAETAPKEARAALLERARRYYARFLARSDVAGLTRAKVELALKKVEADVDRLAAAGEAAGYAVPVTFHWSCADDADIYLNGKPLREYKPDFRTRPDEAPKTFSKEGVLRPGDVITVGARRGGSCGLLLVAVDARGKVVWKTDVRHWRVYFPPEGTKDRWHLPEVARQSRSEPAQKAPGWPPQRQINDRFGNVAESIWHSPSPDVRTCHLFSIVR
jgi:hypothetical protein